MRSFAEITYIFQKHFDHELFLFHPKATFGVFNYLYPCLLDEDTEVPIG